MTSRGQIQIITYPIDNKEIQCIGSRTDLGSTAVRNFFRGNLHNLATHGGLLEQQQLVDEVIPYLQSQGVTVFKDEVTYDDLTLHTPNRKIFYLLGSIKNNPCTCVTCSIIRNYPNQMPFSQYSTIWNTGLDFTTLCMEQNVRQAALASHQVAVAGQAYAQAVRQFQD